MPKKYGPDHDYSDISFRIARADGDVRPEDSSIPIILATEAPVPTYDATRREIVDEVLLLDGMSIPPQVPLLDTHDRDSVRNVMGSIRDLERKTINGFKSLVGRAYFASDEESQKAFQKYRDGHLTDFSVGARRQSVKNTGNRRDVTRSRLLEGSAVVVGADPHAKSYDALALRAYTDPQTLKDEAMNQEFKDKLIARGMPANLDDSAILEWIDKNLDRKAEPEPAKPTEDKPQIDVDAIARKATADEAARITGIDELCRAHKVTEKDRLEWVKGAKTVSEVSQEILKRLAQNDEPVGVRIDPGVSQVEKFGGEAATALLNRSILGSRLNPSKAMEAAKQSGDFDAIQRCADLSSSLEKPVSGEFRGMTLVDIAERFLQERGEVTRGMPKPEIARRAMRMDILERDSGGYNTTGSFTKVLLNTMNKTLLAAYDEAPTTYQRWVRRAPSANDFRDLNRIRFGELPDPEVVAENGKYPEKTTSDNREKYSVDKYGEIFSVTLETIINDDLNAMSRIPAMQGAAMRRKINKVCYAILTANDALSDGVALFHATSHGANLDANALAESALDTGFAVMALQTGLTSGTVLNLQPSYLIVPATLAPTAYRLVGGGFVPTAATSAPLYGPGRDRPLEVVVDGQLDSNSTTAWYLAANPSMVDTVELTFLAGEESPVLSREESFDVDAVKYKIRQTFAAKAIDYRGLYQGNA